jgi:HD-like signal output (HDOD) protein
MPNTRNMVIFLGNHAKATELASHLADDELAVHVAPNTDEMYRLANSAAVDLIVIDNQLPGFLSGIELVERLHTDLLRPTTLLIAAANPKLNERIHALRIASLISPAASMTEIAGTARTALLAGNIGQVPIHPKARMLVQQADFIRPLPQLAVKYAGQLGEVSCSIEELANDISVDPKMTTLILKATNSAALGARIKITRPFDAVTQIGTRRTISLILSSSLVSAQSPLAKLPPALNKWYFDRSVLTAGATAAFARRTGDEKAADTGFVLGLLQDIGILILAWRHNSYTALIDRVRRVGQLRLEVTEQQEFGITHADVSAALLSKWEMPQSFVKLVKHHHGSDCDAQSSKTETRFLQLMRVGEAFANLAENKNPTRSHILNQLISELGMTSSADIKSCMTEAVLKAIESAKLLSISAPDGAALKHLVA